MSRRVTLGGEGKDQLIDVGLGLQSFQGTITYDTTTQRGGGVSYKCDSGAGNAASHLRFGGFIAGVNNYCRAYVYLPAYPTSSTVVLGMYDLGDSHLCYAVQVTSAGVIQGIIQGGSQAGSDGPTLALNTWYLIEILGVDTPLANAGTRFEARLDTTTFVNYSTGFSVYSWSSAGYRAGWVAAPGATKTIYVDDIANNDTAAGGTQISWPGPGKSGFLLPISDNARGLWTGGAGGTTNLWDALNNTPPVGLAAAGETNTSQAKNVAAGTSNCDINVGAYSDPVASGGLGIPPGSAINMVQLVTGLGSEQTSVCTGTQTIVSNPVQSVADTFNFNQPAAAVGTWPTNWFAKIGAYQYPSSVTFGTKPVVRVTKTQSQARAADCCFMGLLVDWTEVGPRTIGQPLSRAPGQYLDQAINRAASY